jgi:hypothetical protein
MKQILHVPYEEKDEAKALGAWWNPALRSWYVPDECETPLEKFEQWVKKTKPARVDSYDGGRTGPRELKEGCACDVLPWEDCEHTQSTNCFGSSAAERDASAM